MKWRRRDISNPHRIKHYTNIGETGLWTAEIKLGNSLDPTHVQNVVTDYVTESGITVVGFYAKDRHLFSMHRWPETRPEYEPTPSLQKCTQAMTELAVRFGAKGAHENTLPEGQAQVVMGRKIGGYGEGMEVAIDALYSPHWEVLDGNMVSARALRDKTTEPYGERAGRIRARRTTENIAAIGHLADSLQQYHFILEAEMPSKTFLYQWQNIPN